VSADSYGRAGSISSFRAEPETITLGETLQFVWSATGGTVSLSIQGESPFAVGLASSGSHVLAAGKPGYPQRTGTVVYEAVVGDAAARSQTTVTVLAVATPEPPSGPPSGPDAPTVSLSPVGATSCHAHPDPDEACRVEFEAAATRYTSISWAGCCAGSTGTTGSCAVTQLGANNACDVSVTGAGGTAEDSAIATGLNEPPSMEYHGHDPAGEPAGCDEEVTFHWLVQDDQLTDAISPGAWGSGSLDAGGRCVAERTEGPSAPHDEFRTIVRTTGGTGVGTCSVTARWTDPWGEVTSWGASIAVEDCLTTTVNLVPLSATSCHAHPSPARTCHVEFEADATNYSAISWGGCCAGSAGTVGTCVVTELGSNTCHVSVTGPGGTADDHADATGLNDAPVVTFLGRTPGNEPAACEAVVTLHWHVEDDQLTDAIGPGSWGEGHEEVSGRCTEAGVEQPSPAGGELLTRVQTTQGSGVGMCFVTARWIDPWGVQGSTQQGFNVDDCP